MAVVVRPVRCQIVAIKKNKFKRRSKERWHKKTNMDTVLKAVSMFVIMEQQA